MMNLEGIIIQEFNGDNFLRGTGPDYGKNISVHINDYTGNVYDYNRNLLGGLSRDNFGNPTITPYEPFKY